ncbi:26157_t:CDS:1, partial [Racocetra persica]
YLFLIRQAKPVYFPYTIKTEFKCFQFSNCISTLNLDASSKAISGTNKAACGQLLLILAHEGSIKQSKKTFVQNNQDI